MKKPYDEYLSLLSEDERKQLDDLLKIHDKWPLSLQEMWSLMDEIWDEMDCDNRNPIGGNIPLFYKHPVWLLNGLFIESHEASMMHRNLIAEWIANKSIKKVLDYGAGFCTLSRLIAGKVPESLIDIIEPFPAQVSHKIINQYSCIRIVERMEGEYDAIVALDVLEHLDDPIQQLIDMVDSVKDAGYILLGNCFKPVIKCHLPCTFHLNKTFRHIASNLSLQYMGMIPGCHVEIYKKTDKKKRVYLARLIEFMSQAIYVINGTIPIWK